MINIKLIVPKVEAEALFEGHGGASEITCIFFLNKSGKLKYTLIFPHKGKSIHHSELQMVLFVCTLSTKYLLMNSFISLCNL